MRDFMPPGFFHALMASLFGGIAAYTAYTGEAEPFHLAIYVAAAVMTGLTAVILGLR